jgi:hypothetical protein
MPIFAHQLTRIDPNNPQEAILKMANHLTYLQEQLEYTLLNLDSRNINEIDTDKTVITNTTGSANIGSYISLKGDHGESFTVGKNDKGVFEFRIKGNGGVTVISLSADGILNITKDANLAIDGGVW